MRPDRPLTIRSVMAPAGVVAGLLVAALAIKIRADWSPTGGSVGISVDPVVMGLGLGLVGLARFLSPREESPDV